MKRSDLIWKNPSISQRLQNVCNSNGINTVGDLINKHNIYLMSLRNFGSICMSEVMNIRKEMVGKMDIKRFSVVEFDHRITVDINDIMRRMDPYSRRAFILAHIDELSDEDLTRELDNRKVNE